MRTIIVSGFVAAVWLLIILNTVAGEDAQLSPAKQYQAIVQSHLQAKTVYSKAYGEAKTDEQREKVSKELGDKTTAEHYAPKMLALLRSYPKDDACVDAFHWLRINCPYSKQCEDAVRIVIRDLIADKRLVDVCRSVGMYGGCPACDKLLEMAIEKSPHCAVQGFARFGLAVSCMQEAARQVNDSQEDRKASEQKAADLFEQVMEKYADLKFGSTTLGNKAKASLFELRQLGLGKTAPEIEGADITGKRMKLSDFRGKVVLVVFWGTWCGPCMADVPHHQALLKRLEGKPFAIVGVDCNENDRELVKKACIDKAITWLSFWDGDDTKNRIADRWNINAWPTLYLLDSKGVIRFKGDYLRTGSVRKDKDGKWEQFTYLDDAVDALLKEIAQKRKP